MSARSLLRCSRGLCALAALFAFGALAAKPVSPASLGGHSAPQNATTTYVAGSDDELPIGEPQFDTTANPLPPNVASLGYAATATSEFGDLIRFSGIAHYVDMVAVTMSSWALRLDYPGSSPLGFTHPITLNLYTVDRTAGVPKPGALLVSVTQSFLIPWRPEPDPTSSSPLRPWRASDGNYYTGVAFNLTFDLGALGLVLPGEVIFGIAFNTQHHGPTPLGIPGPFNSLNLGVSDAPPNPGTDVEPDAVFWETARAENYTDLGAVGKGAFRRDTGWMPHKPAVRFTNSAYGAVAETSALLRALRSKNREDEASLREASTLVSHALVRSLWDGNNRLDPALGRVVFELLAEAASELAEIEGGNDPVVEDVRAAISGLFSAAQSLAETALGDAIIAGGIPRRISRAQGALDDAASLEGEGNYSRAIDSFGRAWREAQLSLR